MSDDPILHKVPGKAGGHVLVIEKKPTTLVNVEMLLRAIRDLEEAVPEHRDSIVNIYGGVTHLALQLNAAATLIGGAIQKHQQRAANDVRNDSKD